MTKPSGLVNLGNSCYLSSVLQLLASADTVLIEHFHSCGLIGSELAKVLKEINEGGAVVVRPVAFIKSFTWRAGFSDEQQDAHEFLLALLNLKQTRVTMRSLSLVDNVTKQKYDVIKVKSPFMGVLLNELICLPCAVKKKPRHISSLRVEPFTCVTLTPTSTCSSVNEAVYWHFCAPEKLGDYVNYVKDGGRCGVGAMNQKSPLVLPELLFLHVSLLAETFMKLDQKIATEVELSGPGYRYKLLAVVVHLGASGLAGHFICYRRTSGNRWVKCDDAKVTVVNESEVLNQRAYILLYQKE